MTTIALSGPAPAGSYRTFRDDAVARHAGRFHRMERRRRTRNALAAALVLGASLFSVTAAASLHRSGAARSDPQQAVCLEAGRRLAPWFRAEAERTTSVPPDGRDDFNLLLTWFQGARAQCASGQTARAVENLAAIEHTVAERTAQRAPDGADER